MATPHNAAIANCAANGPRAVFHAQAGDRYKTGLQISACLYCALLAPCEAIKDRTYITVRRHVQP